MAAWSWRLASIWNMKVIRAHCARCTVTLAVPMISNSVKDSMMRWDARYILPLQQFKTSFIRILIVQGPKFCLGYDQMCPDTMINYDSMGCDMNVYATNCDDETELECHLGYEYDSMCSPVSLSVKLLVAVCNLMFCLYRVVTRDLTANLGSAAIAMMSAPSLVILDRDSAEDSLTGKKIKYYGSERKSILILLCDRYGCEAPYSCVEENALCPEDYPWYNGMTTMTGR